MSMILPPYAVPDIPTSNITPFTYRDGMTYLQRLERMAYYINNTLGPYVDDNMKELAETFVSQTNALIELFQSQSATISDPIIATAINNQASATRTALNTLLNDVITQKAGDDTGIFTSKSLVSVDANSDFPARVETRLAAKFPAKSNVNTKAEITNLLATLDTDLTGDIAAAVASMTTLTNGKVRSGLLADRPAYNTVPPNTVYVATDVAEQYISSASNWSVFGSGGNELAFAAYGGPVVTAAGSGITTVAGFQTTFKAGYRPVKIEFFGRAAMTQANQGVMVHVLLNGQSAFNMSTGSGPDIDRWRSLAGFNRFNSLTPGAVNTVTVGISVPDGFAGSVRLDSGVVQVVTV